MVLSSLAEARVLPSGEKATRVNPPVMPGQGGALLAGFHIPQLDGLIIACRGQGLAVRGKGHRVNLAEYARSGWRAPGRFATSHSLMVLSSLAEARVLPSGEKATESTASACPVRVARSWPVSTSHSLMVLSPLAEARVLPSGEKATELTAIGMPCQGSALLAGLRIPQLDGLILACRGQGLAVRGKGHRVNRAGMPGQGGALLAGLRIPQLDGLILACRGQGLAVRGKGHRV